MDSAYCYVLLRFPSDHVHWRRRWSRVETTVSYQVLGILRSLDRSWDRASSASTASFPVCCLAYGAFATYMKSWNPNSHLVTCWWSSPCLGSPPSSLDSPAYLSRPGGATLQTHEPVSQCIWVAPPHLTKYRKKLELWSKSAASPSPIKFARPTLPLPPHAPRGPASNHASPFRKDRPGRWMGRGAWSWEHSQGPGPPRLGRNPPPV